MFSRGDLAAGDGFDEHERTHSRLSPDPILRGPPMSGLGRLWNGGGEPLTATQILRAGSPVKSDRYASSVTGSGESGPMAPTGVSVLFCWRV